MACDVQKRLQSLRNNEDKIGCSAFAARNEEEDILATAIREVSAVVPGPPGDGCWLSTQGHGEVQRGHANSVERQRGSVDVVGKGKFLQKGRNGSKGW